MGISITPGSSKPRSTGAAAFDPSPQTYTQPEHGKSTFTVTTPTPLVVTQPHLVDHTPSAPVEAPPAPATAALEEPAESKEPAAEPEVETKVVKPRRGLRRKPSHGQAETK
jgi:hypothetical protein